MGDENDEQKREGSAGGLNQVHMSPERACHRPGRGYIWPRIHMQIPIDMTTFTYCIFALGHILARQFPIVGFRPPVRLIDIIGRAADTRLHFYLHTFADQFDPVRSPLAPRRHPRSRAAFLRLPPPVSGSPTATRRALISHGSRQVTEVKLPRPRRLIRRVSDHPCALLANR